MELEQVFLFAFLHGLPFGSVVHGHVTLDVIRDDASAAAHSDRRMSTGMSAIERLYLIMSYDCHVCVIPDIYIATKSESASKLQLILHRCTGRSGI